MHGDTHVSPRLSVSDTTYAATGRCCHAILSARSRADARYTLRAAFTCAAEEEIISAIPLP